MAFFLFAFANIAFSADLNCNLTNMRVSSAQKYDHSKTVYYTVGNLNKNIMIPISEIDNSELAKAIRNSNINKDVFINIQLDSTICKQVISAASYQSFLIWPANIKSSKLSYTSAVDCVDCVTFKNAPIALQLPVMSEMKRILDKSAGFSTENINAASLMLIHLFERMNTKTPNANSLIFTVALFKAFETLKVKAINQEQLQYLALRFKDQLPKDQFLLLQKIMSQIAQINFRRDNKSQTVVQLATVNGKPISLSADDIPADPSARAMLREYFNKVVIENDTSMVFTEKELTTAKLTRNKTLNNLEVQAFGTPVNVAVSGLVVSGKFPVIGGIAISPKEFIVDIDSSVPVQAKVGFKKGFVGMSYTFDLTN